MENALWKILAFILCALLLFLAPLMSVLERQDDMAYNIVFTECSRFADACRDMGCITPNMYAEFAERLSSTGLSYSISLRHVKRSVEPVYKQTGGSIQFTGEYEVTNITVGENDIMAVLFPNNPGLSVHDKARRYSLRMGDLLFVEVRNRGKTMATAIRDMLLFSDTQWPGIFVRAGGMVRNEAD